MPDDPYAVLGVDRTADLAHIRKAYLEQLRRTHPDLHPDDQTAEQRTRDLNHAWEQIRRRRGTRAPSTSGTTAARAAQQRRRAPKPQTYSTDQHEFRVAFTSATLRIALGVFALGLVLLAIFVR